MMTFLLLVRNTLLAAHFLAAVAWVGGMFYAIMVLHPSLGLLDAGQRTQVQLQTLKRFFFYVWHAMPVMLLTGWAMVLFAWGGFGNVPLSVNIMQVLALGMTGVFLYTYFQPWQRLRRAIRPQPEHFARIRRMIAINLVLGALTVTVGSLGHVW